MLDFYKSDDVDGQLLESIVSGKYTMLESEEPSGEDVPPPDSNSESQEKPTEQRQSQPTPQNQQSTPDDVKQNTPDTVNTDNQSRGKPSLNADQLAKKFKESGALKTTIAYAVKKLGTNKKLTIDMVKPYIKAAVEKFCQQQMFNTSVAEMAKAIMALTQSIGTKHVQKQKMMVNKAKQAAAQKAQQQASYGNPAQQ